MKSTTPHNLAQGLKNLVLASSLSSAKTKIVFILFLFGSITFSAAQDCTNCFDDGPSGCGKLGYYDADGDGYGTGFKVCFYGLNPANYSRFGGDCNDNNAQVFPRTFYLDADGDGFGRIFGSTFCQAATPPPAGYVTNNNDCNDNDPTQTVVKNWYQDADYDGYGNSSITQNSCSVPTGMINPINVGGDLDDNDPTVNDIPPSTFYYDNDLDGYGVSSLTEYRSYPTSVYFVPNSGDCNDYDDGINPATVWYSDIDNDGLGKSKVTVDITQCEKPAGNYVLVDGDLCTTEWGPPENNGCPVTDFTLEPWNSVTTITYNPAGEGTSKTKVYNDKLGKTVQSQSLDVLTNKVWATETLYDWQGRPALQTLSAPVNSQGYILHKDNFVRKTDGSPYSVADYDTNPGAPPAVGKQAGTLGWYYSSTNTDEPYQDITDYPFSRTVYSELNPGAALRAIGGNKINGAWPQNYSFTMPASQELSQAVAFGETKYNNTLTRKTVVRDVHGVENVIFVDTDGKTLASARSGGTVARIMSLPIGEQGFADVHVPEGVSMGFSVNSSDVTVYDLITETVTTASPGMPKGFYRVAVNSPEAYAPGSIVITYKENYYDYSLNEYNKIGQLTATYQPVGGTKATKPVSTFKYNTLGQLTEATSSDEGTAQFKYRKDGQIRFSQNSKQLAVGEFSYTNYDTFGRPVESGVLVSSAFAVADPDLASLPAGTPKEQIFTTYDMPDSAGLATELGSLAANYVQSFSAGNVTKTYTAGNATATWYGYDIYGRVAWTVQKIAGLGTKTIDYEYDPVTGAVTKVYYQKNTAADRFVHRYSYNIVGQLTKVETSVDDVAFTTQALYEYYETGGLKRVELAPENGTPLQGIDYVYNLSGQLKSINHPGLQQADDPGGDANDVFGMAIDYNSTDYLRGLPNMAPATYGTDQLNGNIKGIRWNGSQNLSANQNTYAYTYSRDNWLAQAQYGSYSTATGFVPNPAGDYRVNNLTYDANGNIQSLDRNKHTESGSNQMDRLTYRYTTGKPNRLLRVEDAVTASTNADDIKTQTGNNYVYNAIGQLVRDEAEHLTYTYNASGLVTSVAKDCGGVTPCYGSSVAFAYNERGQRVKKTATQTTGVGTQGSITYYVRDVQGSVVAVYTDDYAVPNIFGPEPAENPVYGSGRLGIYYRAANQAHYQLTDHLGNVRAVVARAGGSPQINGATDYYPGGMAMPNRNIVGDYRYNYQGQELDQETGKVAFELRLYDPRINRWLTPDPAKQYASPYLSMGNNWISRVDPDGGEDNPVYDKNGNFLGTTESGLQGEAIIMDAANFTQGMSDASALSSGTLFSDLSNYGRWKFMEKGWGHWKSLSSRPDWDGIVTIDEGVAWALAHPNSDGNPTDALYLDTAQLDFGSFGTSSFSFDGQVKAVNLLYEINPINNAQRRTAYALGNTRIKLISMDAKTVRVLNDAYDWDYHNGSSFKSKIRDGLIWGERVRTGINDSHGVPIRTYGLGTLRN